MKTVIFSLVAIFLLTSISTISFAQPRKKIHKKVIKERMIEKLNLTEEQKDKISDLKSSHQKKMVDFKADLEKAKIDMRDLKNNPDLTRAEIISSVEKINSIKNKMALEKTNHRMDVYELLTEEQKKTWRENKIGMGLGYHKHKRIKERILDND